MRKIKFVVVSKQLLSANSLWRNSLFLPVRSTIQKSFVEQIANNVAAWLLDTATSKWVFDRWVTLTVPAKSASLLPPVGPFLGQHGFNTMNFCNTFNTLTKDYPDSLPIKVVIWLFTDKSIQFQLKTPPISFLLFSAYINNFGKLKKQDLIKIVLLKRLEIPDLPILSMVSSALGTFRSMKLRS